jgi:Lon protease-like protein
VETDANAPVGETDSVAAPDARALRIDGAQGQIERAREQKRMSAQTFERAFTRFVENIAQEPGSRGGRAQDSLARMSDTDPLDAFPTSFAIFPLPNVVLFPGTYLPLHIFEPRYRAMTEAALARDSVIGMILLRPDADAMAARAPLFSVGCAGRIVEHRRLPDGRFHLLLYGERRFRIARELEASAPFREVEAELLHDAAFAELAPAVQRELERTRSALEEHMLEVMRLDSTEDEALRERMRALDPVLLANAIAFGLDGSSLEKQSLLESPDAPARSELLLRLLSFRIAEARLPEGPKSLN